MKGSMRNMQLLLVMAAGLLMAACASMGRPDGGPRDETPPVFIKSNPAPGQTNVTRDRIVIEFDENVQLDDPVSKVVISPAQSQAPKVSAAGHRIVVELRDTMIPDMTYTIDFTDAIKDLNEGNIIDGFSFDFSTGPTIDTLQISGMLFEAENLEPAQGMLVGVYSNLSDTAFSTLPMERITKTNQLGQFTIRNLKEGSYRVFALNDKNRDYKWDRTEDMAFYDVVVTPTAQRVTHVDTIKGGDEPDSTYVHEVTEFLPNNLLLTWFNEKYRSQYLAKYDRASRNRIYFELGAPTDTMPRLEIVNGPYAGRLLSEFAVLNSSAGLDTLDYWITDSVLIRQDTLLIHADYQMTDTLDRVVWTSDTLKLNVKSAVIKKEQRDREKAQKELEKRQKDGDTTAVASPAPQYVQLTFGSTTQELDVPMLFKSDAPLRRFDKNAVHLEILEDSTWIELETPEIINVAPGRPMEYRMDYEWEPGYKYRFRVDSLGIEDIYGNVARPVSQEFSTRALGDYANLNFHITGLDGMHALVQLLNTQDAPVRTVEVDPEGTAIFTHILPGTYYARLIDDRNSNGRWDTGNYSDSIKLQPEDVYYFPKRLSLKKNWDVEQNWDINETPIDLQKPQEIKKNKPKSNKRDDTIEDEEEIYYDEYGNPIDPNDPFTTRGMNNSTDRFNNRRPIGNQGNTFNTMTPMRQQFGR